MTRTPNPTLKATASELQQKASNPMVHAWVSANAGTGKTKVLTQRMLALLLTNPTLPPRSIVAVTFTNAVAHEMRERLQTEVQTWRTYSPEKYLATLTEVLGHPPTPTHLARATQLPDILLAEQPLITTLHGFGQMVLARFPLEAGLSPTTRPMDEPTRKHLLAEAMDMALLVDNEATQTALETLLTHLTDTTFAELTDTLLTQWDKLASLLTSHGGISPMLEHLHTLLKLHTPAPWPVVDKPLLTAWLSTLESGSTNDLKFAVKLQNFLTLSNPHPHDWFTAFCTADNTVLANFGTKDTQKIMGPRWDNILAFKATLTAAVTHHHAHHSYTLTAAVLQWALAIKAAYDTLKAERNLIDFTDMVGKLNHLLTHHHGAWVQYRLDTHIHHLLLDEAQDNSPTQNAIFTQLATNLLAAEDTEQPKTVFVVGDMKQSIYRFQGASPNLFVGLKTFLENNVSPTTKLFTESLTTSFRSSPSILALADATLAPHSPTILGDDTPWPTHTSAYPEAYSHVEIWPLTPTPKPESWHGEGWRPMGPPEPPSQGPVLLANRLAPYLLNLISTPTPLACTEGNLTASDILILTQRNSTARHLASTLTHHGLPVVLTTDDDTPPPLARDAIAWLRALTNPHDTISLFTLLKSPLCGWTDANLLTIHTQGLESLATLNSSTASFLTSSQTILATHTPHQALTWLLTTHALALYPPSTAAANALLEASLGVPTPTELIAKLEQTPLTIPPDASNQGVRIMTVHKAKGLEAPMVILAEPVIAHKDRDTLVWAENALGFPTLLAWKGDAKTRPAALAALVEAEHARTEADSLRSLYVALTRTKERLLVCGWLAEGKSAPDDCWYAHISHGATQLEGTTNPDGIWTHTHGTLPQTVASTTTSSPIPPIPCFVPSLPALTTPTSTEETQRGTILHTLLEILPTIPAETRTATGLHLLQTLAPLWDETTRTAALTEVLTILTTFPHLFASGHTEVPVTLPHGLGRVDRLVEHNGTLWVVDFKTDATPPATPTTAYTHQLQSYIHALQPESPLPVQGMLIYTASALSFTISGG
ncbi:MAG: UvrD-helicase domain-containing protein [Alphaproteobacteria bacterium]